MSQPRICALIPTYNNPATLARVVEKVRAYLPDVIVVDDGSDAEARKVAEELASAGLALVHFRERNGGKGAAVKTGFGIAKERGFTHALQIDADGQHDVGDIPTMLEAVRQQPEAAVLGQPQFDDSAPLGRLMARQITVQLCRLEAWSRGIGDPMCGFRIYPLAASLAADAKGDAMDFDPEIAVRLSWAKVPLLHVPTRVRYISKADGGVSHYHLFRDTALIGWMHVRLCTIGFFLLLGWPLRALSRS